MFKRKKIELKMLFLQHNVKKKPIIGVPNAACSMMNYIILNILLFSIFSR